MEKRYVDKTALEHFALKTKAYVDDTIASLVVTPTPPTTEGWQPQSDWWDIEQILENDTEDYPAKIICLLFDGLDDKATTNTIKGFSKYKLSDGQTITPTSASTSVDISTKFDTTKDKICSKGYKTRYIIGYSSSETVSSIELPKNVIYTIFSGIKFSTTAFKNKYYLEGIKFINNTSFTGTSMYYMFSSCHSLQAIPQLNTSNVTGMNLMFDNCSSLKTIPVLDTSNVTNMNAMFNGCSSLKTIPVLDTSNVTNMSTMFQSCRNLQTIPQLNTSNVTNMSVMFNICSSLYNIQQITGIKSALDLSICNYLNHSTLIRILNALTNLTGQTAKTLTLGNTNLAKLTDTEKAIATNKNWTLA